MLAQQRLRLVRAVVAHQPFGIGQGLGGLVDRPRRLLHQLVEVGVGGREALRFVLGAHRQGVLAGGMDQAAGDVGVVAQPFPQQMAKFADGDAGLWNLDLQALRALAGIGGGGVDAVAPVAPHLVQLVQHAAGQHRAVQPCRRHVGRGVEGLDDQGAGLAGLEHQHHHGDQEDARRRRADALQEQGEVLVPGLELQMLDLVFELLCLLGEERVGDGIPGSLGVRRGLVTGLA